MQPFSVFIWFLHSAMERCLLISEQKLGIINISQQEFKGHVPLLWDANCLLCLTAPFFHTVP